MAKQVKHTPKDFEPEPVVKYFPETQSLWIDSGKSLGEGEAKYGTKPEPVAKTVGE